MDATNHEWHWTMLMDQTLDGDEFAYEALVSQLTPALRRGLRSRARQGGLDVDDVVQDVLLALHLKRETWVRGTPVAPWVLSVARNKLIDAWRKRGRRVEVPIDSVLDVPRAEHDDYGESSSDIERGLASLSERQRDVVIAVSLEGYTSIEAAERLRMSEIGVRVTLHRALKSLAGIFGASAAG
jgi:RNA polymerase sigma factor (sigma-70 family)